MKPFRQAAIVFVAVFALASLSGCAPSANPLEGTALIGDAAGFWLGLWHGVAAPVTFIVSLFSSTVGVYEVDNNGGWYNFGFILGLSIVFGGSARGSHACSRKGG